MDVPEIAGYSVVVILLLVVIAYLALTCIIKRHVWTSIVHGIYTISYEVE